MRMWVLLIDPAAGMPPVTHTDALFADQSQSILDKLVCYWARSVGSRLRVWHCRPKLVDQHFAVAHFRLPLDAGQSIPRHHRPLATASGWRERTQSVHSRVADRTLRC